MDTVRILNEDFTVTSDLVIVDSGQSGQAFRKMATSSDRRCCPSSTTIVTSSQHFPRAVFDHSVVARQKIYKITHLPEPLVHPLVDCGFN